MALRDKKQSSNSDMIFFSHREDTDTVLSSIPSQTEIRDKYTTNPMGF